MDAMDAAPRSRFRWMREIDWDDVAINALLVAAFLVAPALCALGIISGATLGLVMVALLGIGIWQYS